jgi:hypothetical protein
MGNAWDSKRLEFETRDLRGVLVADSDENPNNRHRTVELVHKPTGVRVSPEDGDMEKAGAFTVFRSYARSSWLTELRAIRPEVIQHDSGALLVWNPTFAHQARVSALFAIEEPNIIQLDLSVEGYAHYADYELLLSNYVAASLNGGVFVRSNDLADGDEYEKVDVVDNPAFHGMYPFFPRDEHAANIMTDGRGQKGRWYWRAACCRRHAFPLGFATDGRVDVILMGRPEDVSSVGVTYSAEGDGYDGVARHHALYLSLFGRDLHPGTGWRTQVRLVVQAHGDNPDGLLSAYEQFGRETCGLDRAFQVQPR